MSIQNGLRDTFAAAALTGLLSNVQKYQLVAVTRQAYDLADEMLIQRSPRLGTAAADKAIQDAKDFVRIREQFEAWQKEASVGVAEMDSATDRKSAATPRACASSCSQPFDSAPTTHEAAPEAQANGQGQGNPATPDHVGTGDTPEPVAWYVRYAHCDTGVVDLCRTLAECRDKWSNRTTDHWRYVPLYSQPHPLLTNEEREAITMAVSACDVEASLNVACDGRQSFAGLWSDRAATLRNLLERLR
jgi:hypothetical protein